MKKLLLFVSVILNLFQHDSVNAQAPNWLWAKNSAGSVADEGHSISIDANSNVYVIGHFLNSAITFGSTTLTNAGDNDIFVVKYSSAGNVLWAKRAGGTDDDKSTGISTDVGGNVYVTGYFHSPSITFGSVTLTNSGVFSADIFVVKYDAGGNVLWARSASGTDWDRGWSIATDAGGHVYVAGYFASDSITFGSTTLINVNTNESTDVFVVKYDSGGNVLWAQSEGGTHYDYVGNISTDTGGNVYVTGDFFSSSMTFGSTILTNADGIGSTSDIYVAKYDSSGNVLWAKREGGGSNDFGIDIAADTGANIYITGMFGSPITFGSTTLTTSGGNDIFIVKYNSMGNVLWARSAGGTDSENSNGICTDATGNVYVTGEFRSSSFAFDSTTLNNTTISGWSDIFVVKYDTGGNALWGISVGGASGHSEAGTDICINAAGNVHVTGYFNSASITLGSTTLTNGSGGGTSDIFVAKLSVPFTAIEENSFSEALHIYPNPVTNELRIQNTEFIIESVEIYDVMGQVCNSEFYNLNSALTIDVSSLRAGIYFVRLRGEKKLAIGKFVVEK